MHEVAIIGGGPIGIELAVALNRAGIGYVHFEAGQIGHTMSWWAPQTRWFSSNERIAIAGVPLVSPDQGKCTREQYLAYLRQIVSMFDLPIRTYAPVKLIRRVDDLFEIISQSRSGEQRTMAMRVVLATGGTDRPRRLGVPGEDLPHVRSTLGDPHDFFRQRLLIVGGKNSAVESALRAHHAGARVTLVHRGKSLPEQSIKYWLMPEIQSYIKSGDITAHFDTKVESISLDHVALVRGSQKFKVETDFVLKQIGYEHDNSLMRSAGIELTGEDLAPRFDLETMMTNVPNLFVAGTATGGCQHRYRIFLENCHIHVERIVKAITGRSSAFKEMQFDEPEA